MGNGEFWELGHVKDGDLQGELQRLLLSGSRTEARIVAHLAAVEERRLHLEAGSSSLFDYCCSRLGLSESEAFHRITAARLARRFPVIFGLIEARKIHLTGVCLLRDYLTPENHQELLAEAFGKTKPQVQELLARRFPRPDVASTIRRLPPPRVPAVQPEAVQKLALRASSEATEMTTPALGPPLIEGRAGREGGQRGSARAQVVEPLSAERYRIQLNVSAVLKAKLEHAIDLLSHSNPRGDLAVVIERAVDLLIEQVQKRRFAQTKRPRRKRALGPEKSRKSARSETLQVRARRRHIPNATKRQIAERDGLRCTFVGSDGRRCAASRLTQIHHEIPWACGGGESVENLRILCAGHNRLLAERDFGGEVVASRIQARRASLARDSTPQEGKCRT